MKRYTAISIMALAFLCSCATMGQDISVSQTMYITVSCKKDPELSKDIVRRLETIEVNAIYIQDGITGYDIHGTCKSDLTPMYKILNLRDELSIVPGVLDVRLDDGRFPCIFSKWHR